jgi:hypothetical protein
MQHGRGNTCPRQPTGELIGEHHVGQLRLAVGAVSGVPPLAHQVAEVNLSLAVRPGRHGDDPCRCASDKPIPQQARQQVRREVVEGECVLQPVGGHVAMCPEPADVVEQHIQARVRGEDLGRQPPDLGLRRHVGDEDVHRSAARRSDDRGGGRIGPGSRPVIPTRASMDARPIAAALPIPPVPPVISTVLPVIGFMRPWASAAQAVAPSPVRRCVPTPKGIL